MKGKKKVILDLLEEEKYRRVICYPSCKPEEFKQRFKELKKLQIRSIEFAGSKAIYGVPVLGKGCVGIVVAAYREREKMALKIRRSDADRVTMQHEAQMLQEANRINVGPRFFEVTQNFLLMEYVEGDLLPEWARALGGKDARERLCCVVHLVLEQAWRLDQAGLDHGELSNASKHVIVRSDVTPCIVDFETASVSRRVSNVTSLCQYLFIGGSVADLVCRELGNIDRKELVAALRAYKLKADRESFDEVLRFCCVL